MNINLDVGRLSHKAKDEIIASMNDDLAIAERDLNGAENQLCIKIEVIDEMQRTITRLESELREAKAYAEEADSLLTMGVSIVDGLTETLQDARKRLEAMNTENAAMSAKIIELRAQLAQPKPVTRNYDFESAIGLMQVCSPRTAQFLAEIACGEYAKAVYDEPTAVTGRLEAIPSAQKIERIKLVRQIMPGLDLKAAKDYIDTRYRVNVECPF